MWRWKDRADQLDIVVEGEDEASDLAEDPRALADVLVGHVGHLSVGEHIPKKITIQPNHINLNQHNQKHHDQPLINR